MIYLLVSHNLREWFKATVNYTMLAPYVTNQWFEQADYDGTSFSAANNLEEIDLLYVGCFPPKKKITRHPDGKYDFHHDEVREYETDVGIDENGDQVFTADDCCVNWKMPMGSGKTSNILKYVAYALMAARGWNNKFFNKLDSMIPPDDGSEKIMILLPNKRLAAQSYLDLMDFCHQTEILDITNGESVFFYGVTFFRDENGEWDIPHNLVELTMNDEPCVVSHWHMTKHVPLNRALVVMMLINAAPLRFPFEKEVRLPDGSYVRRRLHLTWLIIFEWYWVVKTMVNGEFLHNAHTTPAMLAKWLLNVFTVTKIKTLEGMDTSSATMFDIVMALQPDPLRTYHIVWGFDPRDPKFFPALRLPKTVIPNTCFQVEKMIFHVAGIRRPLHESCAAPRLLDEDFVGVLQLQIHGFKCRGCLQH